MRLPTAMAVRLPGCVLATLGVAWLLRPSAADIATIAANPQSFVDTHGPVDFLLVLAQVGLCAAALLLVGALVLVAAEHARPRGRAARMSRLVMPTAVRTPLALALGISAFALTACGTGPAATNPAPHSSPVYAASSENFDWPQNPTGSSPSTAPSSPPAQPTGGASPPSGDPSTPPADGSATPDDPAAPPDVPDLPPIPADDPPPTGQSVVVQPGDCLWSIAAKYLGPSASVSDIAYLVDAIYSGNAPAIGDNPDLLHTGITLAIPPATAV